MAPTMVSEAMPDATRILMTVSGSGPSQAGSGTFANRDASIVPISDKFEEKALSICSLTYYFFDPDAAVYWSRACEIGAFAPCLTAS
jgi:hypothetical protein